MSNSSRTVESDESANKDVCLFSKGYAYGVNFPIVSRNGKSSVCPNCIFPNLHNIIIICVSMEPCRKICTSIADVPESYDLSNSDLFYVKLSTSSYMKFKWHLDYSTLRVSYFPAYR